MNSVTFEQAKKDSNIVTIVNAAFHDIEASEYDNNHPEIFKAESKSWQDLVVPLLVELRKSNSRLTILDVGTGTGFVPYTIADFLLPQDKVILSDISVKMLDEAERRLVDASFSKIRLDIMKDGYGAVHDNSVDLVTLNSVLHHIPEPEKLFKEIERLLKPGGLLIIKHEPNSRFSRNMVLRGIYMLLKTLKRPGNHSQLASKSEMLKEVLDLLRARDLEFNPPLTIGELQSLVDIHSPTASGNLQTGVGFEPHTIASKYFVSAKTQSCKTYGYLGKFNEQSHRVRRLVSSILRILFPKDGYFFDVVIIKQ